MATNTNTTSLRVARARQLLRAAAQGPPAPAWVKPITDEDKAAAQRAVCLAESAGWQRYVSRRAAAAAAAAARSGGGGGNGGGQEQGAVAATMQEDRTGGDVDGQEGWPANWANKPRSLPAMLASFRKWAANDLPRLEALLATADDDKKNDQEHEDEHEDEQGDEHGDLHQHQYQHEQKRPARAETLALRQPAANIKGKDSNNRDGAHEAKLERQRVLEREQLHRADKQRLTIAIREMKLQQKSQGI